MPIPFSKPRVLEQTLEKLRITLNQSSTAGGGLQTISCQNQLTQLGHGRWALLTGSATSALEMSAILCDLKPGDEVIMPSYTFVSTANSFVLRGAVPVFVDIEIDTQNLDTSLIEKAITSKTRAIVVVHYAGVSVDMRSVKKIADAYGLMVIEDAAQGIGAKYEGALLGSIGDLGCLSFHSTKNLSSGEGGALLINNPNLLDRAEIIWEKGTNRKNYSLGKVDKYTWVDIGSSFLPSEVTGALISEQLEELTSITDYRKNCWQTYQNAFMSESEVFSAIHLPSPKIYNDFNAHMYQLIMPSREFRDQFIKKMFDREITVASHYVPLHSSPAGRRFGRAVGDLPVTNLVSDRLVRLPMWSDLGLPQESIVGATLESVKELFHD